VSGGGNRDERPPVEAGALMTAPAPRDELAPECKALGECKRNYSGPMPGCEGVCLLRYPGGKAKAVDPLDALVASPHWEWRPGMRDTDGGLCVEVDSEGRPSLWYFDADGLGYGDLIDDGDLPSDEVRPDLDHGGTQGEMLGLVRKAWGGTVVVYFQEDGSASVLAHDRLGNLRHSVTCGTLGVALASTLLAAPPKTEGP
jgi:hypothetical protein